MIQGQAIASNEIPSRPVVLPTPKQLFMLEENAQSTEKPRTQGTGSPLLGPLKGPGMQSWGNVGSKRTTAEEHLETVQGPSDWSSSNPFPMLAQVCWKQPGVSGDRECFSCHPSRDTVQRP